MDDKKGDVMQRETINPKGSIDSIPRGYSHTIKVRDPGAFVFVAGQGPLDAEMKLVGAGDIEAQTRQTFRNIQRNLEAAGAGFKDVVKMTVYVTDIEKHQWPVRNVRAEFIDTARPPVSTMVQVSKLAIPGMLVEIDVIALVA
jgi:enamine deaminase RidA (YjgF/YER057c/UK114 family)